MKKIFFIISLGSFFFASAQQNDFFDIQKHLLKKQKEERLQKLIERFIPNNPKTAIPFFNLPQNPPQAKLIMQLPNGNKVYSLPGDNMPCIVPDMDLYADNMIYAPQKPESFKNLQPYYRQQPETNHFPLYRWKATPLR